MKKVCGILLVCLGLSLVVTASVIFVIFVPTFEFLHETKSPVEEIAKICEEITKDAARNSDRFNRCWDSKMRATGGVRAFLILSVFLGLSGAVLSILGIYILRRRKTARL